MNINNNHPSSVNYWKEKSIASEIVFKAVRASGKGGQNVNKVSTKVELYWSPAQSYCIDEYQKEIIIFKLASKLNVEGQLRVVCEEARGQLANKTMALEKFYMLIANCFIVKKYRASTKPTYSSVAKRLTTKNIRKSIKTNRKKPGNAFDD